MVSTQECIPRKEKKTKQKNPSCTEEEREKKRKERGSEGERLQSEFLKEVLFGLPFSTWVFIML